QQPQQREVIGVDPARRASRKPEQRTFFRCGQEALLRTFGFAEAEPLRFLHGSILQCASARAQYGASIAAATMHAAATGGKNVLKRQMIDRERDTGGVESPHLVRIRRYLAARRRRPMKTISQNVQ